MPNIARLKSHCKCFLWNTCIYKAVKSSDYGVEYYKKSNRIAVRQKKAPRANIVDLGSKTKSEKDLRAIMDLCLTKLNGGESVKDVAAFAEAEVLR